MSQTVRKPPADRAIRATGQLVFLFLFTIASTIAISSCAGFRMQSKATETRSLNATYVNGESLRITTANGSVNVIVEAERTTVGIEAVVTGTASTIQKARARLAEIAVVVDHAEGNILDIFVDFGPAGRQNSEGCSFTIKIPAVSGVAVKTANGAIKLTDTAGAAVLTTSNGRVTVLRHTGPVKVDTSNGSVIAEQVSGRVDIETSNGRITYVSTPEAVEAFALRSSNGSIAVTIPRSLGGRIKARTSNGVIKLAGSATPEAVTGSNKEQTVVLESGGTGGESTIRTSNGSITLTIN